MNEENALLAGNSKDEVTLVRSVQGLFVAEKPTTGNPGVTSENEPKMDPEVKMRHGIFAVEYASLQEFCLKLKADF
jgi:hypothetical protein